MSTAIWVGAIIGAIIGFSIQIAILIYIMKIWNTLNEVIESGAVPNILEYRIKLNAMEMLETGEWITKPKKAQEICQMLATLNNDQEAIELRKQLEGELNKGGKAASAKARF